MRKLISILICSFFCSVLYAQSDGTLRYTARQCYNLKGEVKTMITSGGDTLRFDRQGELIDREGNRLLGIEDRFDGAHKVFFPDSSTRYESNMKEEEAALAKNWYVFDHKGRIVKSRLENTYLVSLETIYVYSPDAWYNSHPSRAYIEYNEDGISSYYIIDYFYDSSDDFDAEGNWIRRSVHSIEIGVDVYTDHPEGLPDVGVSEVKNYVETAQYTYY